MFSLAIQITSTIREETIGPCPCPRWGHPWRLNTFITNHHHQYIPLIRLKKGDDDDEGYDVETCYLDS